MTEESKPFIAVPASVQDQVLSENMRLRGDLLTIARRISHDLRTPLGSIITTCELTREILKEESPSSVLLMSSIFDSADNISQLLERVSFVLKASANPLSKSSLKMGDVVFRALQRLECKILELGAKLSEPSAWPEVAGVATWLEVIWWNLLKNSLDHGKSPVELGWQKMNGGFQFWICDQGKGVPAEKRGKLFQPFHLMHEHDASCGLGLSIVHRLVELQGGHCGYDQRPDGTLFFCFFLPA